MPPAMYPVERSLLRCIYLQVIAEQPEMDSRFTSLHISDDKQA